MITRLFLILHLALAVSHAALVNTSVTFSSSTLGQPVITASFTLDEPTAVSIRGAVVKFQNYVNNKTFAYHAQIYVDNQPLTGVGADGYVNGVNDAAIVGPGAQSVIMDTVTPTLAAGSHTVTIVTDFPPEYAAALDTPTADVPTFNAAGGDASLLVQDGAAVTAEDLSEAVAEILAAISDGNAATAALLADLRADLTGQLNAIAAQIAALQTVVENSQSAQDAVLAQILSTLDGLNTDFASLQAALDSINQQLSSISSAVSQNSSALTTIQGQLAGLPDYSGDLSFIKTQLQDLPSGGGSSSGNNNQWWWGIVAGAGAGVGTAIIANQFSSRGAAAAENEANPPGYYETR